MRPRLSLLAAALSLAPLASNAQTIERVKMTDNQLSCAQLHGEAGEMDKAIVAARAAQASGQQTATAGTAGNVAAEVAGRTGLFGQIGGLAGALFGQVATQTAAGAATQSGRQTVAQAQEREKQATGRKEHVSALFLARGCDASNPAYEPAATPQTAAAMQTAMASASPAAKPADPAALAKLLAPADSVTALPDADPDAHFKGKMGGTFGKDVIEVLPKGRRVAVTGFRVAFIIENTVTATVRASYFLGRDSSGASSTLNLKLGGVEPATLQAITDKVYADFLAQLRFAGREVVPHEELKEFFSGVDAAGPATPYLKSGGGQTALILAPTGIPLWFSHAENQWGDRGLFDQKNHRFMAEQSARLKAITIAPLIVVNFANMQSSGNRSGLVARSAETGAELGLHVAAFSTPWMRSEETRNGLVMSGDDGSVQMTAPIASKLDFGTMKEVTASDNSATKSIFDNLGRSMGMANAGGAARSKSEQLAETSAPAFAAAAVDALGRATGTFAKWFAKYPVR